MPHPAHVAFSYLHVLPTDKKTVTMPLYIVAVSCYATYSVHFNLSRFLLYFAFHFARYVDTTLFTACDG